MTRVGQLITTSAVARRLGVTPSTVTRWASEGMLPCVVLPSGMRRFAVADVDKLLEPLATDERHVVNDFDINADTRAERTEDAAELELRHGDDQ